VKGISSVRSTVPPASGIVEPVARVVVVVVVEVVVVLVDVVVVEAVVDGEVVGVVVAGTASPPGFCAQPEVRTTRAIAAVAVLSLMRAECTVGAGLSRTPYTYSAG
jgi:hypothetical protein